MSSYEKLCSRTKISNDLHLKSLVTRQLSITKLIYFPRTRVSNQIVQAKELSPALPHAHLLLLSSEMQFVE